MGIQFNGTYFIENTAGKLNAYPYTAGAWFQVVTSEEQGQIWVANKRSDGTGVFYAGTSGDATAGQSFEYYTASAPATVKAGSERLNSWQFMLCRGISATNRRMSIFDALGNATHVQDTNSQTPTGQDCLSLGGSSPVGNTYQGKIAEFWWADADVQIDGTQIEYALLHQLAYHGPFSINTVAGSVREYLSLRSGFDRDDFYSSGVDAPRWETSGATITCDHPPLPYSYVRPEQYTRNLMI